MFESMSMYFVSNGRYLVVGTIIIGIFLVMSEMIKRYLGKKPDWKIVLINILFGMYITMIFALTISPVYGGTFPKITGTINVVLFRVLRTAASGNLNFFGNILMFIPFGIYLYVLSSGDKKPWAILWGTLVSCMIEIMQLFNIRGTDVDDILLNTCGTAIGWIASMIIYTAVNKKSKDIGAEERGSRIETLGIILIALIVVMLVGTYGECM